MQWDLEGCRGNWGVQGEADGLQWIRIIAVGTGRVQLELEGMLWEPGDCSGNWKGCSRNQGGGVRLELGRCSGSWVGAEGSGGCTTHSELTTPGALENWRGAVVTVGCIGNWMGGVETVGV